LVKIGTGNTFEYIATEIDSKFGVGMIQYFESFKIKWEWSRTDNELGEWFEAGISENIVYVTLNKPVKENPGSGYSHYLTLIHVGCKYGDKAVSNSELVAEVWSYFERRQVCRADGELLKYYGQWSNGNLGVDTQELLTSKDGICTSWAKILLDVFKIQGFQELDNLVNVRGYCGYPNSIKEGFFIKNWQENPPGTSGDANFPYENIKNTPFYFSNNTYNWLTQEVSFVSSLPAQNNYNCVSDFTNHVFTRIMGGFYDPSYGVKYGNPGSALIPDPQDPNNEIMVQTIPDFDNNALSAFYYIDIDNPNIYLIQMKTSPMVSFIFINPSPSPELDDY